MAEAKVEAESEAFLLIYCHHLHCFFLLLFSFFLPFRHKGEISMSDYLTYAIWSIFYYLFKLNKFLVLKLKLKLISHSDISHSHHYSQKWFRWENHYPFWFDIRYTVYCILICRRRRFHLLSFFNAMSGVEQANEKLPLNLTYYDLCILCTQQENRWIKMKENNE